MTIPDLLLRLSLFLAALWGPVFLVGLLLIMERGGHRPPNDQAVRRAANLYRHHYGVDVHRAIGDHLIAATFVGDSRYRKFLERVAQELRSSSFGPFL